MNGQRGGEPLPRQPAQMREPASCRASGGARFVVGGGGGVSWPYWAGQDTARPAARWRSQSMSPHLQFLLVDLMAMLALCPVLVVAWRRRLRWRAAIGGLYTLGFGVIGLTFLIDGLVNPPLYLHGFSGGVGIGLLLACVGLFAHARA